jgi:URI fold toxin 2
MGHGNSYENEELHHLYEIIDRLNDDVFKYGISFKPIGKDGLSDRIREQVNLLNRVDKWQRFYARILVSNILGKREAKRLEIEHIHNYIVAHGERPRGNPID